jgi:site-specific DNA recombinase
MAHSHDGLPKKHGRWHDERLVSTEWFRLRQAGGFAMCSVRTNKSCWAVAQWDYRCAKYNRKGHPRIRVTEADLDRQILAVFDRMRVSDPNVREWFGAVLRSQTRDSQDQAKEQRAEMQRQLSSVLAQQDRLVNLRLNEEIDADTFAKKQTELRDRESALKLNTEALDRSHHEIADLAVKAFELSQTLREQWLTADHATKRRILEIVCLNCTLVDASLVCEMRKPFDVLAEGLVSENSRGGWT